VTTTGCDDWPDDMEGGEVDPQSPRPNDREARGVPSPPLEPAPAPRDCRSKERANVARILVIDVTRGDNLHRPTESRAAS